MMEDYNVTIQGRAYVLRPDTPMEGQKRDPRPNETEDELSEPLRSYAREAGLIMRPPSVTRKYHVRSGSDGVRAATGQVHGVSRRRLQGFLE